MSAPIVVPNFSGEPGNAIQSAKFLKKFHALMNMRNITENAHMISSFENYLKYNSPADEWFRELNTMEMTWKTLKEFLVRFPPIQKVKKSESELERELCELRLTADDLGKKVKYAGEDVWLHVTFAEKALSLARQAKINTGSNSIWKVRDELPDIICQKVKETHTTWDNFCTAIKEVDTGHIRDGVKRHQKEKEEKERMESLIANLHHMQQQQQRRQTSPNVPLSPMSNASNAMQTMSIGGQCGNQPATHSTTPQANTANTSPFTGQFSGQGTLFHPPRPVTQADRDTLKLSLAEYPLQPNTQAGITTWQDQLQVWKAKNGVSADVTASTGFPLRPGGAAPGSGECYGCGMMGHCRSTQQCTTGQLYPQEHTFRTLCGRILCSAANSQVNFINEVDDEFDWLNDQALKPISSQGNGEGPSV